MYLLPSSKKLTEDVLVKIGDCRQCWPKGKDPTNVNKWFIKSLFISFYHSINCFFVVYLLKLEELLDLC